MHIKRLGLALIVLLTLAVQTGAQVLPPDAIARFHINEANYYADVGKYLEAVEDLNTAFDFAQNPAIKAESLSVKANLVATFLDNAQGASQDYNNILQNFAATPFYEPAIFQSAMLRYQTGDLPAARTLFQRYLKEFPSGARAATAEFLLSRVDAGEKAQPPAPVAPSRLIRIALKQGDAVTLASPQPMSLVLPGGTKVIGTSARITAEQTGNETAQVTSNSPIRVDGGRTYRGSILVIPEASGFQIVNEVPLEEYLYSVVASEVSPTWHMEALKAQAVAARTYAYYHVMHPRSPGKFDVFDDTRSQAYGGYAKEHARVREAVDKTRGLVMTAGGHVILAYFTSNNGGTEAEAECIFGTALPYLKTVTDEYSSAQPLGKWTRRFSITSVQEALKKAGYNVSQIRGITPVKSCASGRVVELMIEHTNGKLKLNTRAQFRRAINQYIQPQQQPENLPEILMNININGDDIEMSGGGWGHGVGLSQYGAKGMAEQGLLYTRILSTYYTGTQLTAVY